MDKEGSSHALFKGTNLHSCGQTYVNQKISVKSQYNQERFKLGKQ